MAEFNSERLEDLELTRDEVDRLGKALKKDEFRKLFAEYCEEVTDPKNKKIYQDEITILEKERGIDVTFINPEPGYVIKTSVDGNRKAFVNVCHNEHVGKPKANRTKEGVHWELPHTLSPPRDDLTKDNRMCTVYDVVFHPLTMHFASRNAAFKDMVTNSACDSVERSFQIKLDRKNLKFPKVQFKGMGIASVLRKQIPDYIQKDEEEETIVDKAYPYRHGVDGVKPKHKPKSTKKSKGTAPVPEENSASQYTIPKYTITHRAGIEFQDFTDNMGCKMNAAIPKELVISIHLPLLNSTADVELDVMEKAVHLTSEKPAKYKLELTLPYSVDENSGSAKFDKSKRKLEIILPVIRKPTPFTIDLGREDSGVESDHGSPQTSSVSEDEDYNNPPLISEIVSVGELPSELIGDLDLELVSDDAYRTKETPFLNPEFEYALPEFTCHLFKNILAFTLHVKNVEPDSVVQRFINADTGLHIKFSSMSSGFYSTYYTFCVKFPSHHMDVDHVSVETWDNNVILQIPVIICDKSLTTYLVGACEDSLIEETLSEIIQPENTESSPNVMVNTTYSETSEEVTIEVNAKQTDRDDSPSSGQSETETDDKSTKIFEKAHSFSESSGDELSLSHSPSNGKGILKHKRSSARNIVNRSVSESSVDDFTWSNSLDNYNGGSESCIPEEREKEDEQGFKKTVRFNDVISKQIFRWNSSILGQKKKNQRKNRNKKRAQERRHSESELSETDERKEKDKKFFRKVANRPHSESELSETEDRREFVKKSVEKGRKRLDSGVCSDHEKENIRAPVTGPSTVEMEFKSDLIFDLDM